MPTSDQESILFLGGPQDGQMVNVERPLPATVRCYYPALQSSSFLTTGSEDPPLLHDHVIYYKRFLWFRGQEHIVYVVAGMSEHDAASMMVDRLIIVPPPPTEQPVPSTEVSQQEEPEPTYPEFILQETEVTHDFFSEPASVSQGRASLTRLWSPSRSIEITSQYDGQTNHHRGGGRCHKTMHHKRCSNGRLHADIHQGGTTPRHGILPVYWDKYILPGEQHDRAEQSCSEEGRA